MAEQAMAAEKKMATVLKEVSISTLRDRTALLYCTHLFGACASIFYKNQYNFSLKIIGSITDLKELNI